MGKKLAYKKLGNKIGQIIVENTNTSVKGKKFLQKKIGEMNEKKIEQKIKQKIGKTKLGKKFGKKLCKKIGKNYENMK